jgi:protein gp37
VKIKNKPKPHPIRWLNIPGRIPGETFNPGNGCTRFSEGCDNCYAFGIAGRFKKNFPVDFKPTFYPERLEKFKPKPGQPVFMFSASDIFHPAYTDEQRIACFDWAARFPESPVFVLTKRVEEMQVFRKRNPVRSEVIGIGNLPSFWEPEIKWGPNTTGEFGIVDYEFPSNIWLGVSVEMQKYFYRVSSLIDTGHENLFISFEPLLEEIHFTPDQVRGIKWIVFGAETNGGKSPRRMEPRWGIGLFSDSMAAGIPLVMKQWSKKTQVDLDLHGEQMDLVDWGTEYPADLVVIK